MALKTLAYALLPIAPLVWADAPNPGSPWTVTLFLDDFDEAAGSSPSSQWAIDTGHSYPGGFADWGTGEIESYTGNTENLQTDGDGNLLIIPVVDDSGQWTSARIETVSDSFEAPEGGMMRVEASIAMPNVTNENGLGYWPTFWLMGAPYRQDDNNWPSCGELDIMENVNGNAEVRTTLHCDVNPGGECDETLGLYTYQACSTSNCNGNFHTYTLVIDRSSSVESITFSVDGQVWKQITSQDLSADVWANAIDHSFYVILNVAMGGSFPNGASGQTTPTAQTESGVPMIVDYVAVWST